jgi:ABC-type multidrug transport system fused ATPase/permease subunit
MANVKFENITFRYGQNTVLNNFSLEVESGKIVCLVGPSGTGKNEIASALTVDPRFRKPRTTCQGAQ